MTTNWSATARGAMPPSTRMGWCRLPDDRTFDDELERPCTSCGAAIDENRTALGYPDDDKPFGAAAEGTANRDKLRRARNLLAEHPEWKGIATAH